MAFVGSCCEPRNCCPPLRFAMSPCGDMLFLKNVVGVCISKTHVQFSA